MGNKPRASQGKYKSASLFFSAISAYMIVAATVCAIHVSRSDEHALYAQMKLSVISTFGLWVGASILAFDPAHLVTSAFAYLLLSPSYIIILNTYVPDIPSLKLTVITFLYLYDQVCVRKS
jgi:chitin synthase